MCNMKERKDSVESNNNFDSQQPSFSSSIVHPRHKRNRFVDFYVNPGHVFTNHSQEYSFSFSPRFCKFECNTTTDWLNGMV